MLRVGTALMRLSFAAALAALLAVVGGSGVNAVGTPATAIPFGFVGWEYKVVAPGAGSFADGDFAAGGVAPFGTTNNACPARNNPSVIKTAWPVNTDLLVRTAITLPPGANNLRVFGTVDNDAVVYVNGTQVGSIISGNCASPNIDFTAPDGILVAGTNTVWIRATDRGIDSFLDVQVTYDDAPVYQICPLYDQTKAHKAGSTVPLKLQLCDESFTNLSDPSVVVHATGYYQINGAAAGAVVEDSGNANPDQDFRYDADLGGYIYNLKTTGFSQGTWAVTFTVNGESDPSYVVIFGVK